MKIETFLLERWMTRHETHVRYDIAESGILPLSTNDLLDFEPVGERAAALDRLLALPLGYSEARGTEALRTALAALYARGDADHILVTTGAIEANFLLFNVLLDAGDHVIAPYPAYQQLYSVPRAIGCDVSLWHVGPETGYRYDVDALERLITPRTRVIVVNTPHNPTGAMLSPDDATRVYRAGGVGRRDRDRRRGVSLAGGARRRAVRAADVRPRAARRQRRHAVEAVRPAGSAHRLDRRPAGPGPARAGACATTSRSARASSTTRSPSSRSRTATRSSRATPASSRRTSTTAAAWMAEREGAVSWTPPRGGLLALFKYDLPMLSLELADRLATEYSVMLAPGSAFGYEHHLRLGIGQRPDIFREGLRRAGECLDQLR